MKKKSYLSLFFLPLLFIIVALLPACKKNNNDSSAPPVIASIKSYVASPNDTVLHSAVAKGQWVVITGQNLQNATQISFDGVPASFNIALLAPNSAVVQIPTIQFSTIDTAKLYTVKYATTAGSTTFSFKLGPAAPTITSISNVFAAPGDSIFLYGADLVLVQRLVYGGTPIPSFKSSLDGSSLGFLMPAATPTSQILVTTKSGTVRDTINATPTITRISNENANQGDSVFVYGTYLKNLQSLSFAGVPITSFKESSNAGSVRFVMPASTKSGPVSLTTKFGTVTTSYNVYTPTYLQDGVIANMDNGWSFNGLNGWWAKGMCAVNNPANDSFGWLTHTTAFDGFFGKDNTVFVYLQTDALGAGKGGYSDYGTSLSNNQWVPTANLSDPVGNWAIKFEMSVPNAWNGGTLCFTTGFAGSNYVARYEPWQVSSSSTANYTTKGWQTVTIPLSSFRASDPSEGAGKGASVASLTALLGSTGNTSLTIYVYNFDTASTKTGFYGAFDNIRIVKIK
ncbi:glycan-binding surface protein [Mucilaginibacter sp. cycad4]|uniref:glycan-binding surface protein n=1 Tax=Mucilaginibacter sp. cycad4 TaxID=3342096 RepID=UPI002AABC802|nr:glycan-binding surface protein [Mucilaginibacter gossypii]WPU97854.1 glycan-binding surface protein [Mucilaginibacter gossypii]